MKKSVLRLSAVLLVVCLLPLFLWFIRAQRLCQCRDRCACRRRNEKTDVTENTEETTAPVVQFEERCLQPSKPASDPEILPTIIIPVSCSPMLFCLTKTATE